MTTTFQLYMPAAEARLKFGDWRCRIEPLTHTTCNIVFFVEDEWKRFEQYAEENGIEYKLV